MDWQQTQAKGWKKPEKAAQHHNDVLLLICQVQEKKPEDYKKKYCHGMMHGKNYVIKNTIMVNRDDFDRLEAHHTDMVNQIKEMIAEKGIFGEIIVQRARGGLGRRGKFESTIEWKAKRKAGNATILRTVVE